MPTDWRSFFGFEEQEVSFEDVHMRYRRRMTSSLLDTQELLQLSEALEAARKELASGKPE